RSPRPGGASRQRPHVALPGSDSWQFEPGPPAVKTGMPAGHGLAQQSATHGPGLVGVGTLREKSSMRSNGSSKRAYRSPHPSRDRPTIGGSRMMWFKLAFVGAALSLATPAIASPGGDCGAPTAS